jgi:Zn-dependent metalloprotease
MVKQWVENKMAKDSDWLIGEGCFMPERKGTALRNMKNPGTAYDKLESVSSVSHLELFGSTDSVLQLGGKDPQPADYKGIAAFKAASLRNALRVKSDRGGVHLFSGVPNRAFVLCALAFGGYSWEKAGKIWWTTATTHRIAPNCTFLQFADVTVAVAEEQFGVEAAKTVRAAWNEVGVTRTI